MVVSPFNLILNFILLMEFLSIIWPWIQNLWFPIVIALLLFYKLPPQFDEIKSLLKVIANNVWKELLSEENSIMIFKLVLHEHIDRKIDYIKDILTVNNIDKRKDSIIANIKTEFTRITQEECEKLSRFNCPAWDMWDILLTSVDFEELYTKIFSIFFWAWDIDRKCTDIKKVLESEVNNLVSIICKKSRRFKL